MVNSVIKWAEKNGYNFRVIVNNTNDGVPVGILVCTDYVGAYPPSDVYAEHEKIRRYCNRTGHKYESGAMHTGARIFF